MPAAQHDTERRGAGGDDLLANVNRIVEKLLILVLDAIGRIGVGWHDEPPDASLTRLNSSSGRTTSQHGFNEPFSWIMRRVPSTDRIGPLHRACAHRRGREEVASAVRRGLEAEGFAVDIALTGTDGLWMATENRYDVIVLDIMLPASTASSVREPARSRRLDADPHADRGKTVTTTSQALETPGPTTTSPSRFRSSCSCPARGCCAVGPVGTVVYTAGDLKVDPITHRCLRGDVRSDLDGTRVRRLGVPHARAGEVIPKSEISTTSGLRLRRHPTSSRSTFLISAGSSTSRSIGS